MKEIISKRLRQCRKERGLSQLQVSIYCDITEKTYQNYELMTREPRIEILVRLADLYQVSLDYLTGRTDSPKPYPPAAAGLPEEAKDDFCGKRT